jgi:hypothetical protein
VSPATFAHDLDPLHRSCICGSHCGCHVRRFTFDLCHSPQVADSPVPEQGVLSGRLLEIRRLNDNIQSPASEQHTSY